MTIGPIAGARADEPGDGLLASRNDERSLAARGLIAALLVYNTGALAILTYNGVVSERVGVAVWPGVLLHTVLRLLVHRLPPDEFTGIGRMAQGDVAGASPAQPSGDIGATSAPGEDDTPGDTLGSGSGGRSEPTIRCRCLCRRDARDLRRRDER